MDPNKKKAQRKLKRARRVRGRIVGSPERPRLSVFRSARHFSAQLIDDTAGRTLMALSSQSPEIRGQLPYWGNVKAAALLGKAFGEKAKSQGFTKVAFDRGPYKYHGRVKAFADAAREAGLEF